MSYSTLQDEICALPYMIDARMQFHFSIKCGHFGLSPLPRCSILSQLQPQKNTQPTKSTASSLNPRKLGIDDPNGCRYNMTGKPIGFSTSPYGSVVAQIGQSQHCSKTISQQKLQPQCENLKKKKIKNIKHFLLVIIHPMFSKTFLLGSFGYNYFFSLNRNHSTLTLQVLCSNYH